MNIDFPFHFDSRGRTAASRDHIRDLLIQYFFTHPGERVNRPEFGGGLRARVFQPNSLPDAAALQFTVRAGLQEWLGEQVEVRDLEVLAEEATLTVAVAYLHRASGRTVVERVTRQV